MKTIRNLIGTLIIVFLSAACALFVVPRAFGVQLYAIISGSMEPAYHLNDLIYTVPADCGEIRIGDTITFAIAGTDSVATHRVIQNDVAQGQVFTKGDANDVADAAPVPYENVKGVVRFRIPKIGAALMLLSSKLGRILALTAGAAIVLISMILAVGSEEEGAPKQEKGRRGRALGKDAHKARKRSGNAPAASQAQSDPLPEYKTWSTRQTPPGHVGGYAADTAQRSQPNANTAQRSQPDRPRTERTPPVPSANRQPRNKKELPPCWR